jgi:hypothetical protein
MAGEASTETGQLTTMLARLQREGDGGGRAAFAIATHLAEDCFLGGRLDESAQRLLALAEQGRRQRRDTLRMLQLSLPLILALTTLDRLDQARQVVLDAMPWVRWFGWRAISSPYLALYAARRGRLDTAARLAAAGEARRASVGGRLEVIGHVAERKVRGLLTTEHSADQLGVWFREGAALSDEEFDRLVLNEA